MKTEIGGVRLEFGNSGEVGVMEVMDSPKKLFSKDTKDIGSKNLENLTPKMTPKMRKRVRYNKKFTSNEA